MLNGIEQVALFCPFHLSSVRQVGLFFILISFGAALFRRFRAAGVSGFVLRCYVPSTAAQGPSRRRSGPLMAMLSVALFGFPKNESPVFCCIIWLRLVIPHFRVAFSKRGRRHKAPLQAS
jgi:hypothetical protein